MQLAAPPKAQAVASTGSITLKVQEAMTVKNVSTAGTPITKYKWLINKDDTGDPGTISNQGTQQCLPPSAGKRRRRTGRREHLRRPLPVAVGPPDERLRADRRAG